MSQGIMDSPDFLPPRGGDAALLVLGRFEESMIHPEGFEDLLSAVFIEGLAGNPPDQLAQDNEINVGV